MTSGVPPVGPMQPTERRGGQRRATDRRSPALKADLPVVQVEEQPVEADPADDTEQAAKPTGPDPAFAAQLIGQGNTRRGLRGGPPVLDAARASYLSTEFSGRDDRRPSSGEVSKTEV